MKIHYRIESDGRYFRVRYRAEGKWFWKRIKTCGWGDCFTTLFDSIEKAKKEIEKEHSWRQKVESQRWGFSLVEEFVLE